MTAGSEAEDDRTPRQIRSTETEHGARSDQQPERWEAKVRPRKTLGRILERQSVQMSPITGAFLPVFLALRKCRLLTNGAGRTSTCWSGQWPRLVSSPTLGRPRMRGCETRLPSAPPTRPPGPGAGGLPIPTAVEEMLQLTGSRPKSGLNGHLIHFLPSRLFISLKYRSRIPGEAMLADLWVFLGTFFGRICCIPSTGVATFLHVLHTSLTNLY